MKNSIIIILVILTIVLVSRCQKDVPEPPVILNALVTTKSDTVFFYQNDTLKGIQAGNYNDTTCFVSTDPPSTKTIFTTESQSYLGLKTVWVHWKFFKLIHSNRCY